MIRAEKSSEYRGGNKLGKQNKRIKDEKSESICYEKGKKEMKEGRLKGNDVR